MQAILEPGRVAKIYVGDGSDRQFLTKALDRWNRWILQVFGGWVTDFYTSGINVDGGNMLDIEGQQINLWQINLQAVRFEGAFSGADEITELRVPLDLGEALIDIDNERAGLK